ncbi:MAG: RraA family protein [Myxococcota bacterium]
MDPRIAKVTSASLTDAMGRHFDHRCHVLDLRSPTPDRVVFGPAATLRYLPRRADWYDAELHNFGRLFYEATGGMDDAHRPGCVLVLSAEGAEVSVGGGTKLSRLHHHRLAGIVTNGRLRDFGELRGYDFGAWCAGETVRWGGDTLMPFSAGEVVTLRGVTVRPGDYIYADAAAVVVIPASHVDVVLDEAMRVEDEDRGYMDGIRVEDPSEVMRGHSDET